MCPFIMFASRWSVCGMCGLTGEEVEEVEKNYQLTPSPTTQTQL